MIRGFPTSLRTPGRTSAPGSRTGSAVALGLLAALAPGCSDTSGDRPAATAPEACESPTAVSELPEVLLEASGIARDPRYAGVFWAHNDSGNPAEMFALDADGRVLAVVRVAGATDRDIEDIAVGPCAAGSCIYLGDIGDNMAVRPSVFVHRLPLPDLPAVATAEPAASEGTAPWSARASIPTLPALRPEASWRLVYPTGPRDAESLAVDAERGELIIVTKGREDVVELYAVALADLEPADPRGRAATSHTLRRVGRLPVPIGTGTSQYVTAADLSQDGTRLAVRSYTTLFDFAWPGSARFDTLAVPEHSSLLGALEAQGEGVTWDASGEALMLVSEGRGGRPPSLSRIRCPAPRPAGPEEPASPTE